MSLRLVSDGDGHDDEAQDGQSAADADEDVGQLLRVHPAALRRRLPQLLRGVQVALVGKTVLREPVVPQTARGPRTSHPGTLRRE